VCNRTIQWRVTYHYQQYSRLFLAFEFLISLLDISKFGEDVGKTGGASGNAEEYRVNAINLQAEVNPATLPIEATADKVQSKWKCKD
jgi:hypothetical protein